ncbi:MAG: M43 family zinc metalloprotease [Bacteroidota bacterium]
MIRLTRTFVFAAVLGASVAGAQRIPDLHVHEHNGRRCATPHPTMAELAASVAVVERHRALLERGLFFRTEADPVTVPVAFHVITAGPGEGQGDIPEARIQAQMDTLNSTFAAVGFRFVLAALQRVENPEWYNDLRLDSQEESAMKRALALDPARYMNVYTANLALDFLGWATIAQPGAEADIEQGVVLLDQSLPGGDAAPYNLGHTGTHEVGHWVGLLHPFLGGCSEPNDGVADTPQERSGASGCPTSRDSCPLDPGLDLVNNYMDYSDDACMSAFTAGQIERAEAMMAAHRPTIVAGGGALATFPTQAFARSFVGVAATAPVRVTNLTGAPLTVTGATSTDPQFAAASGLTVPPGEVGLLDVTFTPAAVGDATTLVTLQTSAGPLSVEAAGTATLPPTARLGAERITGRVLQGEDLERTLGIENAGGGELTFALAEAPNWVASVDPEAGVLGVGQDTTLSVTLSVDPEAEPDGCAGPPGETASGTPCTAPIVFATNDPLRPEIAVEATITILPRPDRLAVGPVFPNPGRGRITVPLAVPDGAERLTVEVYDTVGRLVATLADDVPASAGYPELTWDAGAVPQGLYLVRVRSGERAAVARLTITR